MKKEPIPSLIDLSKERDELSRYAPALDRRLRAIFSSSIENYAILASIFSYVFAHGGREDITVPREADESFNPRLARIAQLLIDTCQETSMAVIGCAFLSATTEVNYDQLPAKEIFLPIAERVDQIFNRSEMADDESAVAIVQAAMLDSVRHLHQSTRDKEKILEILSMAKEIAILPLSTLRYQKLKPLLDHAISQQERRCARS